MFKSVITAAILVAATSTTAFAGQKAQNLINPVQVKIQTLETQVEGLATVATSLATQLRAALDNGADESVITELQAQLETANENGDALEEELNTVKNNWWHTKQNVVRLNNEINDLEDTIEALQSDSNDDAIVTLQAQLDEANENYEYYYAETEKYDNWVSELKLEVNALEEVIDGYQNQNSNFEEQAAAWISEQEEIKAELNTTITNQGLELEAVYADLEEAYEEMDVIQDQNIDLQAAIDSNVQVEALTNKIHSLDDVIAQNEEDIAYLNAVIETQGYALTDALEAAENADTSALEETIEAQAATIAAYDDALDDITTIITEGGDNVLDDVLSFISALDLNI